ncbi:MAG: DUF115 domain-containing protein [Desulfovibrio sp.]|nr:MAG: DUF115 domain-containing protein [Desulfovibrio sp.]
MDPSPFLMKNLQAMVAGESLTARWLSQAVDDPMRHLNRLVRNPAGLLDYRLDSGKTLFGAAPPQAFYNKWDGGGEDAASGATVIVGANLGYGVNQVLQATPNSHKVLVLEPDPEMLLTCLGQTDYTPFFAINKLIFLPPQRDILEQAIRQADVQFLFGKIFLRLDGPSQQLGPQYAKWGRICKECLENFSIEMATLRRKQDTMVGNELHNFQRAVQEGSLMSLEGKAKGVSAVILGAGPSLEDFAEDIAEDPGHTLLTTALQTLPALHRHGITPHFCMAIDYSPSMRRVFDRLDREWAANIPLLYSSKLDPEVLAAYPGPTIPFWTMGGVATFVFQGKEYILDAGGNVSVALFRFLSWCGVERIVLAGQDFAWRGDASHATGHHAGKRRARQPMQLKDLNGNTIHSSLSYVSALRDMERDIKTLPVQVANLYGGGAVVGGTENLSLNEARMQGWLASEPGSLDGFLQELEGARQSRPKVVFEPRAPMWSSSIRNMRKHCDKLFKKPGKNSPEIGKALEQVHLFLRQDPLYLPYLYNEIMDVAGLLYRDKAYTARDNTELKRVLRKVLDKVREMDRLLAPDENDRARAAAVRAADEAVAAMARSAA